MNNHFSHSFSTVDYEWTEAKALFVKIIGVDAEKEKTFEAMVKFIEGTPYGDILHAQRSQLSPGCRKELYRYLLKKYENNDFF